MFAFNMVTHSSLRGMILKMLMIKHSKNKYLLTIVLFLWVSVYIIMEMLFS